MEQHHNEKLRATQSILNQSSLHFGRNAKSRRLMNFCKILLTLFPWGFKFLRSHHSLRDCCFPHSPVLWFESATSSPPSGSWVECLPPRQCWYSFGRLWNLLDVRPLAMGLLQFLLVPITVHPSSCSELCQIFLRL